MKEALRWRHSRAVRWLESPRLAQGHWLVHAFSTRNLEVAQAGNEHLKPPLTPHLSQATKLWPLLQALGAAGYPLASLRQIHSTLMWEVSRNHKRSLEYRPAGLRQLGGESSEVVHMHSGDVLMTDEPGVLLSVRTADCMPILLVDAHRRHVAVIHAGWRGTLRRVVEKTVGRLQSVYGSKPEALLAVIGPSIGACCYAVGREVYEAYQAQFPDASEFFFSTLAAPGYGRAEDAPVTSFLSASPPGHDRRPEPRTSLDLRAAAASQLRRSGLRGENIIISRYCTCCRADLFPSYRAEGQRAGRMWTLVGIRHN